MKLVYNPSKDELLLKINPLKGKPNKESGPLKIWWDHEGNICAVAIAKYTEELEEFNKCLNVVQLSGIWRGIKITDSDISKVREELLRKIEEKW